MTLSRQSRIVRVAFWMRKTGTAIPSHTTLCAFFWRVVAITALAILGAYDVVRIGLLIIRATYHHPLIVGAIVLAVVVLALVIRHFMKRGVPKLPSLHLERVAASAVWQGAKAVKSKVCPVIEIRA